MGNLDKLFERYDALVVLDTETTGLRWDQDQIIEFAAVRLEKRQGVLATVQEYDQLIALAPGSILPYKITELTGIRPEDLRERGISKTRACRDIAELLSGEKTLILAYNAHFDLCFLFYTLQKDGDAAVLRGKDKLDLLTVYRDRHGYPHRLENAISTYGLEDQVQNSHRAIDDVKATVEVMRAMEAEKDDLDRYINLFGYIRKYGIGGKPIGSVTYVPQDFEPGAPAYERIPQMAGRI